LQVSIFDNKMPPVEEEIIPQEADNLKEDVDVLMVEAADEPTATGPPSVTKDSGDKDFDPTENLPLRDFVMRFSFMQEPIAFNPVVSLIGVVLLWGLAIWSMVRLF